MSVTGSPSYFIMPTRFPIELVRHLDTAFHISGKLEVLNQSH